jgi:S1-C subfamily serine protease
MKLLNGFVPPRPVRALTIAVTSFGIGLAGVSAAEPGGWKLPAAGKQAASQARALDHMVESLHAPLPKPKGTPTAVDLEKMDLRGIEAVEVYRKVAPAVVYVTDGASGHGTGSFISADGWLITNNHVVDGMPYSAKHKAQVARVVYGKPAADGSMEVVEGYLDAIVYRRDPRRDLALLKMVELPPGVRTVPYVSVAAEAPPSGENCFAIGHPSSGVLWTLRSGIVSGRGRFPHDNINFLIKGADQAVAGQIARRLENVPSRMVTLSSCGINPGDSGGPLVNEAGELIAVTFAVPRDATDKSAFSYHVHLDEVKAFLKDRPSDPAVVPPSDDFEAEYVSIRDLDDDGESDARLFQEEENEGPIAMQIDLDQNSAALRKKGASKLVAAESDESEAAWDYEFAIALSPTPTLFYDTDDDGAVDLILLPQEKGPTVQLRRTADLWTVSALAGPIPVAPFQSDALNARYRPFAEALGVIDDEEKSSR